MKEKSLTYLAAVCVASATLTACSGPNTDVNVATPSVMSESEDISTEEALEKIKAVKPGSLGTIQLAKYKNLAVSVPAEDEVTDEEIGQAVESKAATQSVSVDDVESGDTVTIDFIGKKDGEEFEGGSAEDYSLKIGSGTFIDGFEDALIGMKKGETKDIDLVFPEDYSNDELAGQPAVFTVTVNDIQRVPELTDELAKKIDDECDTVDALREKTKKELEDEQAYSYLMQKGYAALDELKALSEVSVSDEAVEWAKDLLITQYYMPTFEKYYGVSFAEMLDMQNTSVSDFRNNLSEAATQLAEDTLVIDALAEEAGVDVSEEDSNEYARLMGTTIDTLKTDFGSDYIDLNTKEYAVLKYLTENVVFTYTKQ